MGNKPSAELAALLRFGALRYQVGVVFRYENEADVESPGEVDLSSRYGNIINSAGICCLLKDDSCPQGL
jgi:hypothetical protein